MTRKEYDAIKAKIAELTATLENAKIEPEPKATGWAGRDEKQTVYYVNAHGEISKIGGTLRDDVPFLHEVANGFTDKAKAEEVAAAQLCYRLLKRFSDENGGEQIDWGNHEQYKYYIYYNTIRKTLEIDWDFTDPQINVVYFASEEICQQAIDLFRPQIMAAMGIKEDA
jgi:hypothetical protein